MSFMIPPSQQQPRRVWPQNNNPGGVTIPSRSPHATTTTQEGSNVPSCSPHPQTTTLEGIPCPSHSSGPLSPTKTTWEGFPPKRQGRQVIQQMLLVIDDPVLLHLFHGVDAAPFADNLVRLKVVITSPRFSGVVTSSFML